MDPMPDSLTNMQKDICEYGGAFGVLLSLVCLIQHLIAVIPGWLTYPMIPEYFFSILAFLLLALQKPISSILLIINSVFLSIIQYIFITHFSFSLVVLLLFLYSVVAVVVCYVEKITQKLKRIQKAKQLEESFWKDKL